jgi:hypothetical protein
MYGWKPIDTLYDWLKEDNDAIYEVAQIWRNGTIVWSMAASVRHASPWSHYPDPPTHWRQIRSCSCHPIEAPVPCQEKYALSDCERSARIEELLAEAARQIAYLHEKFQETGSGNAVLARINVELNRPEQGPHFPNPTTDPIIRRLSYWQWWVHRGRPGGAVHPGRYQEATGWPSDTKP